MWHSFGFEFTTLVNRISEPFLGFCIALKPWDFNRSTMFMGSAHNTCLGLELRFRLLNQFC